MVKEKRARHQLLPVAPTLECGSGPYPGLLSQGSCTPGGWDPLQPEEMTDATRHGLQSLEAGPAANVEAAHLYARQVHPMSSPTAAQLPGTSAN